MTSTSHQRTELTRSASQPRHRQPETIQPASPFMTVPEAVSYLRTSRAGLYRMIDDGKLPKPIRRGGRALFARSVLERQAQHEVNQHLDWELGL